MRAILLLIVVALVSGCATVGVERVEQLKSGTTIAPLSLMRDSLGIRHVGTTIIQNERRDLDVAQWRIDEYTEVTVARLIRDGQKFSVIPADTNEARKKAGELGSDFWIGGPVLQGGSGSVTEFAKDVGADCVLVVGPIKLEDPFFGTNQSFSGYGIYQRSVLGFKRAINYLTMRLVLFDGKSGAEVARTHDHLSAPRSDADWMESEKLALTESNATSTKSGIEQLIERMLKKGLTELKLVQ
jgi:hypothetical protein